MHFTSLVASVLLTSFATTIFAAPIPQLAGEGAACNSVFSSTDNGIGYGVENAENNVAGNINTVKGAVPRRRQLAGEGAACNSVLSSTDNGVGYGVENAENNVAGNINTVKGAVPAVPATPAVPKRQLDKIANGAQAIGNAAGVGAVTAPVTGAGDQIDGATTGAAANAGAQIGGTEESTLEGIGSAVPKL